MEGDKRQGWISFSQRILHRFRQATHMPSRADYPAWLEPDMNQLQKALAGLGGRKIKSDFSGERRLLKEARDLGDIADYSDDPSYGPAGTYMPPDNIGAFEKLKGKRCVHDRDRLALPSVILIECAAGQHRNAQCAEEFGSNVRSTAHVTGVISDALDKAKSR